MISAAAIRLTFDGGEPAENYELLFVTPGDVNFDGECDANDWANIMRWTLEAPSRFDTRPDDERFKVTVSGETRNLWYLAADFVTEDMTQSSNDTVDSNDWATLMYLTLEAWKK